jgi:NAD-dependent SIR2 family protein deacetylase
VPEVYTQLAQLLEGKDYFIIDSNPDGMIQKSGVELGRIYKAQGDMARMQCSKNCKDQTWIGKSHFEQMEQDSSYEPRCPHCGAPMIMNVYVGKGFCEEPYQEKNSAYFRFINSSIKEPLVVLELGVGYTMPELIRFPFEQIVMNHPNATLVRINTMHPLCVEENKHKAICAEVDIKEALPRILEKLR